MPVFILGSVFYTSILFILGIIISRNYGAYSFGEFNYAISIISPLVLFLGGGLRLAATADSDYKFSAGQYLFCRIILSIMTIILCGFIAILFNEHTMIFFFALYKVSETFYDVSSGILQRQGDKSKLGYSMLFCSFTIITAALALSNFMEVHGVLLISAVLIAFFSIVNFTSIKSLNTDKESIYKLIKHTFTLSLTVMYASLLINVPRIYLGSKDDILSLAGYSSVLNIVLISSVINSIAGQFFLPHLKSSKRAVLMLFIFSFGLGVFFLSTTIYFDYILKFIYGNEISVDGSVYFILMLLLLVFNLNSSLNYLLIARGLLVKQNLTMLFGVVITLIGLVLANYLEFKFFTLSEYISSVMLASAIVIFVLSLNFVWSEGNAKT